mgnify:CR=1 FL=1
MKHILIIGATGQIGSELTMELRKRYGNTNVVAGYIPIFQANLGFDSATTDNRAAKL